jgi:hypothetical protein
MSIAFKFVTKLVSQNPESCSFPQIEIESYLNGYCYKIEIETKLDRFGGRNLVKENFVDVSFWIIFFNRRS